MNSIFSISTELAFQQKCLETFHYQYDHVQIYRQFVDYLGLEPKNIHTFEEIPFLPIEMFKNHTIIDRQSKPDLFFQ